jgi:hypothetical protein
MRFLPPWLSLTMTMAAAALACLPARAEPPAEKPLDGFNVIVSSGHPFGSDSAERALIKVKNLGARAIAIVPFLWQSDPASPDLVRGADMGDDELRAGIRDAQALGFTVVLKPHVWVPGSWAGAVSMTSEPAWQTWFANYRRELHRIARIAAAEKADALVIGTELAKTTLRPEWSDLIADVRGVYSGRVLYVAHNIEEAEQVPFWQKLDAIGVSLYPPLGTDNDRDGWRLTMRAVADRLDALAEHNGRPIIVGEIGLRSAQGAAIKPWESAEERATAPYPALQAEVLADWLDILNRPSVHGVMIWRWLTDPDAGGMNDTDFTIQGKPAEHVVMCAWTHSCDKAEASIAPRF